MGLRVQTAPEVTASFRIEVRFVAPDTREELPFLRDDRQRFRVRPGLRTYCCLKIPAEPGRYLMAIVVDEQFLAYLPAEVKEKPSRSGGGLLQPIDE